MSAFLVAGCSSGGGGDSDDSDSGTVSISISPDTISRESLAFISAEFRQIFFDDLETIGVTLKLIIPKELVYGEGSASLTLDRGALPLEPIFVGPAPVATVLKALADEGIDTAGAVIGADDFYYVVFAVNGNLLSEEDDDGQIDFNLRVDGQPVVPYIFADLDRDALASFDPEHSDFDTENATEIEIARPLGE